MVSRLFAVAARVEQVTAARLGRRGLFLLAWGVLFVVYGIGLYLYPLPDSLPIRAVWHNAIPHEVRAAAWIVTGLVACWAAFRRGHGGDVAGFIALTLMPVVRMASYGFAWLVSVFTPFGEPRGWVSASFYAVLVLTVILVAGWHERAQPGVCAEGVS